MNAHMHVRVAIFVTVNYFLQSKLHGILLMELQFRMFLFMIVNLHFLEIILLLSFVFQYPFPPILCLPGLCLPVEMCGLLNTEGPVSIRGLLDILDF